ncbi:MAG: SAF domain-containing protein [Ilumatobacteraceae bacterium]
MTADLDLDAPPHRTVERANVPGPARRVRVPWLAAAVGAALLTAAIVLWGFGRAADRREVLMVAEAIGRGETIEPTDLTTSFVAVDAPTQLYSAEQLEQIVGSVAATDLAPGDLVGPSTVTSGEQLPEGWQDIGGLLRAGNYPSSIAIGDRMLALPQEGEPLGVEVLVVDVSIGDDRAALVVLAAPPTDAGRVAQWSADENLVLVGVDR